MKIVYLLAVNINVENLYNIPIQRKIRLKLKIC